MAHALNFSEKLGRHALVVVKEVPWHGLGKVVERAMTSKECIIEAGLDFPVRRAPLQALVEYEAGGMPAKKVIPIKDNFATYRGDTHDVFGVVGSKYEIVQNTEAFEFFDDIVHEGAAIYETAGALYDGRTVFITAKLPYDIKVGDNDVTNCYLLFTMSHDGSGAVKIMFTPIRVVCNNTLIAAMTTGLNRVSFKHTRSVHDNIKKAKQIMGISSTIMEETRGIFRELADFKITEEENLSYVYNVFLSKEELELVAQRGVLVDRIDEISTKKKNIIGEVLDYTQIGPGQNWDSTKGTLFGAYNGIAGYFQNTRKYKDANNKMDSIFFGTAKNVNETAMELAVQVLRGKVSLV